MGKSIRNSDAASGTISYNTGASMRSWGGQEMTVSVLEDDSRVRVVVGGSRAQQGGVLGGGPAFEWGEKRKVTLEFLDALKEAFKETPEPEPEPQAHAERPGKIVEEIERLAALRSQGALSDTEFEAAKAKLLA
jgi:hypothetical protein